MAYSYYRNTLQKVPPETITLDAFKFILSELGNQNKKIWYHKLDNGVLVVSWLNPEGHSSSVVINGKDKEFFKGVKV